MTWEWTLQDLQDADAILTQLLGMACREVERLRRPLVIETALRYEEATRMGTMYWDTRQVVRYMSHAAVLRR